MGAKTYTAGIRLIMLLTPTITDNPVNLPPVFLVFPMRPDTVCAQKIWSGDETI